MPEINAKDLDRFFVELLNNQPEIEVKEWFKKKKFDEESRDRLLHTGEGVFRAAMQRCMEEYVDGRDERGGMFILGHTSEGTDPVTSAAISTYLTGIVIGWEIATQYGRRDEDA